MTAKDPNGQYRSGDRSRVLCWIVGHDWSYSGFDTVTCDRCTRQVEDSDLADEVFLNAN